MKVLRAENIGFNATKLTSCSMMTAHFVALLATLTCLSALLHAQVASEAPVSSPLAAQQTTEETPRQSSPFPNWVDPTKLEYALGLGVTNRTPYVGSDHYDNELRPVWWLRYDRLTIVGPRGGMARDPDRASESQVGTTALLVDRDNLRFNFGLRVDSGRKSSDDAILTGLPNIKRRLHYLIGATYTISPDWSLSARVSGDTRSNQTGTILSLALGTRGHFAAPTTWASTVGASFADQRYLQAYFGVPDGLPRPAYAPRAGPLDVNANFSVRHQIYPHWSIFGSLGVARLLGDAGDSPLTRAPTQRNLFVGVAYQSRPSIH